MRTKFTMKRLMLPHYFQKIGFTVVFLEFACVLAGMVCYWAGAFDPGSASYPFFSALIDFYGTPWVRMSLRVLALLSLAFIAFSREKVEDEIVDDDSPPKNRSIDAASESELRELARIKLPYFLSIQQLNAQGCRISRVAEHT